MNTSISTTFLDTSRIGVIQNNQVSINSATNETMKTLPSARTIIRKQNVQSIIESLYKRFNHRKLDVPTAVELRTNLHIILNTLSFLQKHDEERTGIEEAIAQSIFKQAYYPACVPEDVVAAKARSDEPHAAFVRVQINETFSPRASPSSSSTNNCCCMTCWKSFKTMLTNCFTKTN